MRCDAVVVAFDGLEQIRGGTDNGELADGGLERQCAVAILEEHDRFTRGFKGEFAVRRGIDFGVRNGIEGHGGRRIEHAEPHARREQTRDGGVDFGFAQQIFGDGLGQRLVGRAAIEIGPGFDRVGVCPVPGLSAK